MKIYSIHKYVLLILLCAFFTYSFNLRANKKSIDLLIIGAGASGVAAGVEAARMGINTMIVEEMPWVGGMLTSAGVSAIDGNYNLPSGFWGEFKDAIVKHYGGLDKLKTGWVSKVQFEPQVGEKILRDFIYSESNINLKLNTKLISIKQLKGKWVAKFKNNNNMTFTVNAKILIDATELGDVAKIVGVKYDLGMESSEVTNEDIAPAEANDIVQDITYVAVLKDYGKDSSISMPANYDKSQFSCCAINDLCINPKEPDRMWNANMMITYGALPNKKYMINWPIEGNDYYLNLIEMTPIQRVKALQDAKDFTLSFVYFIQHELGMKHLGLADDVFPTTDNLALIPYYRESRRIHGLVRFCLNDLVKPYDQSTQLYRTCIAVGDYPVDHHHSRYNGCESLPRLYFHKIPSYGLPIGTLIPNDVNNFIVAEKSISVSNIVNGTTRLQPVVLQIGTAAGTLASIAIKEDKPVSEVSVREVQNRILEAGGYLLPYLDVDKSSKMFKPLQRIGSTGILKGVGKNVEWENQTWIYPDSLLKMCDMDAINEVYPGVCVSPELSKVVTVGNVINMIKAMPMKVKDVDNKVRAIWDEYNFGSFDQSQQITRGEYAVLIDQIINPFKNKEVTITGAYK